MNQSKLQHLNTLLDLDRSRLEDVLDLAAVIKREYKASGAVDALKGRTVAMIFEKPSLRTRVTFEAGMVQLGGAAINLDPSQISLGNRESVKDAVLCLSRWVDGIVARTFSHKLVMDLAKYATVPVINALTDLHHPCQALALGQTLMEKRGKLTGLRLAFVGDGNNVANSLSELAAHLGMHFILACPKGYEQNPAVLKSLEPLFRKSGGSYTMTHDAAEGVSQADCIYTDVWVSMGEEAQAEQKKKQFSGFQVNSALLDKAPAGCLVTHCLPAHVDEEITQEVMDSERCVCFDEAENRLHAQKAVLLTLIAGGASAGPIRGR
ncbi:MAG TPA: ornithine carbamoyltransferase [Fibrobacteria bacterium]|nr:ornithine carbamoyltransferase [Fibrobacteria bacterium]